jgi:uncharacterized membrane protein
MSTLERRYRRLLACYPRDHRERNGEEMLGVLLADAGDRRRPGWQEIADLLWGAARMHLRRIAAVDGGIDPRDVLAIVSLLAPVAMLAAATYEVHQLGTWANNGYGSNPWTYAVPDAELWVIWSVVGVLSLVGLRRIAAVGAWLGVAGFVVATVVSLQESWSLRWWTGVDSGWVMLGVLTAVALTWSPGPARGRELVGKWAVPVMAVAVAAPAVIAYQVGFEQILPYDALVVQSIVLLLFVVGAVVAAGPRSRVGRRAAVILLLPIMTLLPAALYTMRLLPTMDGLTAGDVSTVVEAGMFSVVPVTAVLLALGVVPSLMRRRTDKPVA